MKSTIQEFYHNLYKESVIWRHDFNIHDAPVFSNEELELQQREFEEEEVLTVSDFLQVTRFIALMILQ